MDITITINNIKYRVVIRINWVDTPGNGKVEYKYYIPLWDLEGPYPSATIEEAILAASIVISGVINHKHQQQ